MTKDGNNVGELEIGNENHEVLSTCAWLERGKLLASQERER